MKDNIITIRMNSISIKLGFWSAFLITIMGLGYGLIMGIYFLMKYPIPTWTSIENYATFTRSIGNLFFSLGQIIAFLSGLLFIILLCCIHEYAQNEKKILTRIGMCFTTISVVLASITYFVQFTVVPQNISNGNLSGLEQFVQLNTKSFMSAIVILGWGLFMGLASYFIAPVFSYGRLEKFIKWFFILSGIFLNLNFIGYILQNISLCLISTSIYNITLSSACISLCILFKKQRSM